MPAVYKNIKVEPIKEKESKTNLIKTFLTLN